MNLNAQNIKTEIMDGLVDKNYESFSILNSDKKVEPNTKESMIISSDYMTSIITYTEPTFPTLAVKNEVEDAIRHELIASGYDHKKSGSNMLVIYSILSKNGEIKGDFADENESDIEEYDVSKGTLIISIIDRESGETVWSGFNDGALSKVTSLEENKIVRSVSEILNRLRLETMN
ncbi:DUF4136 domain-containing protein [Marivirga salinae]|uniref:DUF4136 domain-containing protein n=1 Tax=Marivirga salinarum TaxID=3059078 RepID=A0AA51RDU0_9BACT|nr:DUF4136 domain-containing protein [Marivirga sp. BDSF4-3]WMN11084.1 DUF4136 domain-containing protein [Marivirga sp. BDSF4-3]